MSPDSPLLQQARAVADAVLYEGYLLYPYRASADKNRIRWQFGVLGPSGAYEAAVGEESTMRTDCLLLAGQASAVSVRVRFLQLQSRTVERRHGDGRFGAVARLECAATTWIGWDEALNQEIDLGQFEIDTLLNGGRVARIEVSGGTEIEHLHDEAGELVGRIVRRRWPLTASLRLECTQWDGQLYTVHLDLANQQPWSDNDAPTEADALHRDERARALRHSLLSAHVVLQDSNSGFVSVIDPPELARVAARSGHSHRLWPVLLGQAGEHEMVLAAPIILYDWPEIAPDSAGDLFDATEIDELLSLRVMALTDAEKREARATDPRAAEIVDRCESLPAEAMERMHGSIQELGTVPAPAPAPPGDMNNEAPWWDPGVDASVDPATDSVEVDGVLVARGSTVYLRPRRQADAQDLFFEGQTAMVHGVYYDVDGGTHLAVVLRDDPASDLHQWYGRYLYFQPDEVAPVPASSAGGQTGAES